ncbi:MAG: transcriptional regulator [Butyrivibrio sp.]|jgi:DNA-binding transcriptional regulator YiaG|nr:transcriptional regulator [Butyrivibrio sp.]
MDISQEVRSLRDEMGMNRREFCDYYAIPYRTMVDWEAGKRKMPEYLLRLMEYKARMERMIIAEDR